MKKIFGFLFFGFLLSYVMTGCSKDNEPATGSGTISTSGTINASISGVTDNSIDSLIFWNEASNYDDMIIGKTKVSNGSFSLTLDTIATKYLFKIANAELTGTSADTNSVKITVSDPTAYISDGEGVFIDVHKSKAYVGSLVRTNCTLTQYEAEEGEGDQSFKGLAVGCYIYCNKNCSITGTAQYTEDYDEISSTFNYNYDLNFKKGWNELIVRISALSTTSTSQNITVSVTANEEPSGMKWLFVPNSSDNVKASKVVGVMTSNIWHTLLKGKL